MSKDDLLPALLESYEVAIARNRVTGWGDLSPKTKLLALEYSKAGDLASSAKRVKVTPARAQEAIDHPLVRAYINDLISDSVVESVITRDFLEHQMLTTLAQVNGDEDVPMLTKDGVIRGQNFNAPSKIRLLKQMQDFLDVQRPARHIMSMVNRINPNQPRTFSSPDELWSACTEYFKWLEDNPIYEIRVETRAGREQEIRTPRPRMPTESALVIFIGSRADDWGKLAADPEYQPVIEAVREIIREVKMANAAVNNMNSNFVARDLGMVDAYSHEHFGKGGGPLRIISTGMSEQEAAEAYADTLREIAQ